MENKVYSILTEKFIDGLKENKHWIKPFFENVPQSINGHKYQGFNRLILMFDESENGIYLTFNEIKKRQGFLKKGSKARYVSFYKIMKGKKTENGETIEYSFPLLRYYKVFRLQDTNVPLPERFKKVERENDTIQDAENLVNEYIKREKIKVENTSKAFYNPSFDSIGMPVIENFINSNEYYSTFFHEMIHSTGNEKRLDRDLKNGFFGNHSYSFEELVAEIGSAFLMQDLNLLDKDIQENSQAYLNNWIKVLTNNKKWIIQASSKAEKAVNYIKDERGKNVYIK